MPVAFYGGSTCRLLGNTVAFDPVRLAMLYKSHDTYAQQMAAAVHRSVGAGYLLPVDAADLLRLAQESTVGKHIG